MSRKNVRTIIIIVVVALVTAAILSIINAQMTKMLATITLSAIAGGGFIFFLMKYQIFQLQGTIHSLKLKLKDERLKSCLLTRELETKDELIESFEKHCIARKNLDQIRNFGKVQSEIINEEAESDDNEDENNDLISESVASDIITPKNSEDDSSNINENEDMS